MAFGDLPCGCHPPQYWYLLIVQRDWAKHNFPRPGEAWWLCRCLRHRFRRFIISMRRGLRITLWVERDVDWYPALCMWRYWCFFWWNVSFLGDVCGNRGRCRQSITPVASALSTPNEPPGVVDSSSSFSNTFSFLWILFKMRSRSLLHGARPKSSRRLVSVPITLQKTKTPHLSIKLGPALRAGTVRFWLQRPKTYPSNSAI